MTRKRPNNYEIRLLILFELDRSIGPIPRRRSCTQPSNVWNSSLNLKWKILESSGRRSRCGYQKGVSYETGVYKRYYFHTFEAFNFDMNHSKMIMVEYVVITVTLCGQ